MFLFSGVQFSLSGSGVIQADALFQGLTRQDPQFDCGFGGSKGSIKKAAKQPLICSYYSIFEPLLVRFVDFHGHQSAHYIAISNGVYPLGFATSRRLFAQVSTSSKFLKL